MALTGAERETVITFNDDDDTVRIWTAQRTIKTILDKSPVATLVKSSDFGNTYTVPMSNFKLASALRKTRTVSEENRKAASERLKKMHAARAGEAQG